MQKDPKKFTGQVPENNTYPGERTEGRVAPLAIDLLPLVFRTDTNKKIFGAALEDMFQPSSIENVNYAVGRPSGNAGVAQEFLPRKNSRRQFETGLLVQDATGTRVLTADDIALSQGFSDQHLNEKPVPVSVMDLPINPDKFVNWSNYYWLEEGMPTLYIVGTSLEDGGVINIVNDIIGKKNYTIPTQTNGRSVELKNGMRVVFQKTYPNRNNINGDTTEQHIADGSGQLDFKHEMTQQYNKNKISVYVDGALKTVNTDYAYTLGSIIWREGSIPTAGSVIDIDLPDYWVTEETIPPEQPKMDRRWQVEGVGSPSGIRLLPRSHQTTTTVYSSTIQSLWDQTTIPWDRIEWDGDIPGINKKHYVLQNTGASNRSAFSRVNVWVHRDTILTVCNYLNIKTEELIDDRKRALRPILEFDHRLELYNHGVKFRHWVEAVVDSRFSIIPVNPGSIGPFTLVGQTLTKLLVYTSFNAISSQSNAATARAVLDKLALALDNNDDEALSEFALGFEANDRTLVIETLLNIKTVLRNVRQGKISNVQRRVLWIVEGNWQNKIITFKTNSSNIVVSLEVESANDGDATVVLPGSGFESMMEYQWVNGQVVPAQTRLTPVQKPLYNIYTRDQLSMTEWYQANGVKPTKLNSTIIEFLEEDDPVDTESGYKLSFLTSKFKSLDPDSPAANPMYDIQFKHTLQDKIYYLTSAVTDKEIPGPYSFRRLQSVITDQEQPVNEGLSFGYRRAWFRLRSWAINTYNLDKHIVGSVSRIAIDARAWPTYEWNICYENNMPMVCHSDNLEYAVENLVVAGRGENLKLNTIGVNTIDIFNKNTQTNVMSGLSTDGHGQITVFIPADIEVGFYELHFNGETKVNLLIIDPASDPRAPSIKVDGIDDTDYNFIVGRGVDNYATNLTIEFNTTSGIAEIKHQGEFGSKLDHATSIPGIELNPLQILELGTFTPSRVVKGMQRTIKANDIQGNLIWPLSPQIPALDGALMADISAIRSTWLKERVSPTLTEALASRSMTSWRWFRKFISLLDRYNKMYDLGSQLPRLTLDQMLEEMNTGINYSVPDAVSGMAFNTNDMNIASYLANGQTSFAINTGSQDFYRGVYGPDHVYVYVNDVLQDTGYTIVGQNVVFDVALATDAQVSIYHSGEEFIYSGIPASPAKLGLGGVFKPQLIRETWGNYDRVLIQCHDGSKIVAFQENWFSNGDPRDAIILELEKRIYAGCVNRIGDPKRQRLSTYIYGQEASADRALAELQWFFTNNIDYKERTDFISDNPWTWNYGGKSWRRLYLDAFGTVQPHSHPWEILGFDEKPVWWDTHYSWTDPVKRANLEMALMGGKVSEPGQPVTYDFRVRRISSLGYPVGSLGQLLNPVEWGLPQPSLDQARQPWDIGSYGPAEDVWLRTGAGMWAACIDKASDLKTASEFVETGINPFINPNINNSPKVLGDTTMAPSNFVQARPTIGIGAVLFETNRELNLLGESPLLEMSLIQPVLQFSMGGFTDSTVRFRMYHTRYQSGNYVPEEDFGLTLDSGVAEQQVRYSAVRVEKDDTGFRVYGFDPECRYFEILEPVKENPSGGITGSYRNVYSTPTGDYIDYNQWNTTAVKVPYGSLINSKQELFDFFAGMNELQSQRGLIFDQLNDRGTINNWKQAAVDALSWIDENWSEEHFCVVEPATAAGGFKIHHEEGQLDQLNSDLLKRGKILFASGKLAQGSDLLTTRDYEENTDLIQSLNDEQVIFADLKIRKYDHVFFFNSKTRFNDLIIDHVTGQRLDYLGIVGRRTRGWDGRYQANGVLPTFTGLLPGFDTLINDIIESRRPEKSQFDNFLGRLSKSNVVPVKTTVLSEVIPDAGVEFLFRQGLQSASGTNLAITAFFRNANIDIPGRSQDINVNEQWLFASGEFGRLGNRKIWELELKKDDLVNDRQIIRFLEGRTDVDLRSDNIIDIIGPRDPRWINRDSFDIRFEKVTRANIEQQKLAITQKWLPSAGVANLDQTDIKARDLNQLSNGLALDNEKVQRLLSILSFSKFRNYEPEDLAWNDGALYKCVTKVQGGENTAWDPDQWMVYNEEATLLPPNIWVSDYNFKNPFSETTPPGDADVVGWNVLQLVGPTYVEECCPNAIQTGLNESKVTFGSPHRLVTGDVFLMVGAGDGNYDKFHTVKERVDDYNVLIEGRSTSNTPIFNLVVFKLTSMKFGSVESLQAQLNGVEGLKEGMKAFVEPDGSPDGEYIVYKYTNQGSVFSWQRDETYTTVAASMVDTHTIESVTLLDADNENLLATVEVFDPYKGLTIDEVARHIDYRDGVDPAIYNTDDLGLPDPDAVNVWNNQQLGRIWWDTSRVRYVEYEQGDINYRARNWGRQFDGSEVIVYEWVRSEQLPTVDDEPMARQDTSSGVGVVRYNAIEEVETTGATRVYYYYWKKNVSELPANSNRRYSALQIQTVLDNPDVSGVTWMSPIDSNALIISNIRQYLTTRNSLILRIEQKDTPEQQHETGILVSEGFTGDFIPEYLFRRLRVSLTGRDNFRKSYPLKTWQENTAYEVGSYVIKQDFPAEATVYQSYSTIELASNGNYGGRDIPIIQVFDDGREEVKNVLRPIFTGSDLSPIDEKLHRVFVVANRTINPDNDIESLWRVVANVNGDRLVVDLYSENEETAKLQVLADNPTASIVEVKGLYISSTDFRQDFVDEKIVVSATSAIIRGVLESSEYRAVINASRRVPDPRLHPLRRYGNNYTVIPQTWFKHIREARRNFVRSANAYLIKINAVGKDHWNAHLLTYKPLFGPYIKDLTPYWRYVDYLADDYQYNTEQFTISDISEMTVDGIYGVTDSRGVVEKSFVKKGNDIALVYQRNGTIQFNDAIWDGSLGDAWDMARWDQYAWDEDNSEVVRSLITALREDLFVEDDLGYFNLFFFDMVKESLRQIPNANWVSKTTYLNISQVSTNDLTPVGVYFDRRDVFVKNYINEVKPYHSKIVDINQSLSSNENITVNIEETLVLSIEENGTTTAQTLAEGG